VPRWRRIARLKPSVVLQRLEPPHMRVTLVSDALRPEELIPIALGGAARVDLLRAQAGRRGTRTQEKWRPFLPTVIARGGGTPPLPMAFAVTAAAPAQLEQLRAAQRLGRLAIWTLQNLGAGNVA